MVKEISQPQKYQCEFCYQEYYSLKRAQKCEAKGLPPFKYNIGDTLETIVKVTIADQIGHFGLHDVGTFSNVTIKDRHHFNHTPVYVIEHPQIQGQYWAYPGSAFELPEDINDYKEPRPDSLLVIGEGTPLEFKYSTNAMLLRSLWWELNKYLSKRKITSQYRPHIIAEPINPM